MRIILLFSIFFLSCNSIKKSTDYLKKKDALAGICADEYPVTEKTIFKPGDTITQVIEKPGIVIRTIDTITIGGKVQYRTLFKPCPASFETTLLIHDTLTIIKENTARVAALGIQLQRMTAEKNKYQERAGKWWLLLILGAGISLQIGRAHV